MGFESPSHWLIIAVVVVILFGYKKLPEMSRSLGRSLRIFKTEMKGMTQDEEQRVNPSADVAPTPPSAHSVPAVAPQSQTPQPAVTSVPQADQTPVPVPHDVAAQAEQKHTPPMAV